MNDLYENNQNQSQETPENIRQAGQDVENMPQGIQTEQNTASMPQGIQAEQNTADMSQSIKAEQNTADIPQGTNRGYPTEQDAAAANVNPQPAQNMNYYGAYPNPAYYTYYGQLPYQQVPQVPEKKKHTGIRKFFTAVALALVFGLVAGGTFIGANEIYHFLKPSANNDYEEGNNNLPVKEEDQIEATTVISSKYVEGTKVSDIVESAMPSTVAVNSTFTNSSSWFGPYESSGSGSGIIVGENKSELLIITNNHVVDSANLVEVVLIDETTVAAEIKGTDSNVDLALLAVKKSDLTEETLESIKIAKLGSSDDVRVGEMVVAIGNALGYGQSVTVGYVSAKNREINIEGLDMILLQTDAAINPGNSGGALLNLEGEVIGINSIKYAASSIEGMGFAIPVSNVTDIIETLMNILAEDEKGYLGVRISSVTEAEVAYYGWPEGIYVVEFTENSGAMDAGIQIGDIITKINGINVKTTSDLINKVTVNPFGTKVTLTVQRRIDGAFTELEYEVTLRQSASLITPENETGENEPTTVPVPEEDQRRKLPR